MVFKNQKAYKNYYSKVHNTNGGVLGKCGWHEGYVVDNGGYVYPKSILEFKNLTGYMNKEKFRHPTQKPVDLIRYLIRTYTNPGDIVLDNCMGSGTTCIAAMREGRDYVGFEKDEQFYEMILRRIEDEKDYVEKEKKEKKERAAVTADPLY